MWTFIIPGDPRPNKRHRDAKHGGKFDPNKEVKEAIALVALSQHKIPPLSGPLKLEMRFYMPIPLFGKAQEGDWMIRRPDGDNLQKLYMDALKHLYKDDSQICLWTCFKKYSKNPRTEFIISKLS